LVQQNINFQVVKIPPPQSFRILANVYYQVKPVQPATMGGGCACFLGGWGHWVLLRNRIPAVVRRWHGNRVETWLERKTPLRAAYTQPGAVGSTDRFPSWIQASGSNKLFKKINTE